jgi:hypothetical protein
MSAGLHASQEQLASFVRITEKPEKASVPLDRDGPGGLGHPSGSDIRSWTPK